jgi:hypothetical protein
MAAFEELLVKRGKKTRGRADISQGMAHAPQVLGA